MFVGRPRIVFPADMCEKLFRLIATQYEKRRFFKGYYDFIYVPACFLCSVIRKPILAEFDGAIKDIVGLR